MCLNAPYAIRYVHTKSTFSVTSMAAGSVMEVFPITNTAEGTAEGVGIWDRWCRRHEAFGV